MNFKCLLFDQNQTYTNEQFGKHNFNYAGGKGWKKLNKEKKVTDRRLNKIYYRLPTRIYFSCTK